MSTRMTNEEFQKRFPLDQYRYEQKSRREKGHMGQTEIYTYDIIEISTGETVYRATYTDHMNVNGFATSQYWE